LPARISTGESRAPWQGTHTNSVERAMRPIALNRKNSLFAGHDAGAANWACLASLIETAKIHGTDPHAYLADILLSVIKTNGNVAAAGGRH
jgi:hypothetical protein